MNEPVYVWGYLREYEALRSDILATVDKVFSSGRLMLGDELARFEREMADYVGVAGGVGVNSGTDALQIALMALGVGAGDEVITVSNTAVPTVSAIVSAGAMPVFVDCCAADGLMNPDLIEPALTERTRAIIPVHLYGQCCDMEAIMTIAERHDLKVIEDCAQSTGARRNSRPSGTYGDLCAFSFYPTKVLGGYGDGGWIGCRDAEMTERVKSLRMYGMEGDYYAHRHGVNSRLDEVHAAILSLKLKHIDTWIERRRRIADRYEAALADLSLVLPHENAGNFHTYYIYVVAHPERERLLATLRENNVFCNISYPFPIHTMRGYAYLGGKVGDLPETEARAEQIFSLPMFPSLRDDEVDRVCEVLRKAV